MSNPSCDSNATELLRGLIKECERCPDTGCFQYIEKVVKPNMNTPEQAVAATLGVDDNSRWFELFGTPERAARTLANVCQFTHDGELCDRCQCYLFGDCDRKLRLMSEQSIYDALLEWLESEVRDD